MQLAELVPGCTLDSLTRRSQSDFEIDFFERLLTRDPDNVDVLRTLGDLLSEKGWHRRAVKVDLHLATLRPNDPLVLYNLACSQALLCEVTGALASLKKAIGAGFSEFAFLAHDPDLESLRSHPEFQNLLRLGRRANQSTTG